VAAALDCCLHVVRRLFGASPAQRLARHIVLPPHRQGGQAQFIEKPVPVVERDERLSQALAYVLADPAAPHSLDSVACVAGLTRRTFTRRFQKQVGSSFSRWLAGHRVSLAQELLETTAHSIEEVARLSGLGTSASLRQHFRASLSTTPDGYRREFAGQRLTA
jgi:transcriptional regulator GlxA family with amidase domain